MKEVKDKLLFVLISILTFLVILFGISFISPYKNNTKNRIQTALVNKKYLIDKISITNSTNEKIILYNFTDFWGGEYFNGNEYIYFPVDAAKINELIKSSTDVISLDLVTNAKSENELEKFSVNNNIATVSFYQNDLCVSKINFGALNQTMDKVFLWTDKNMKVYAMDCKIIYYLDTSIKFWCDQNFIPQEISKNLDSSTIQNLTYKFPDSVERQGNSTAIERFASLRFSEILTSFSVNEKLLDINISDGNGSLYKYSFYPAKTDMGNCYIFELKVIPSMLYSDEQKEFIKKLNYCAAISQWTYNSITELLK